MKYLIPAFFMLVATLGNASQIEAKGLFTAEDKPEMWCMALNIYYESRSSNRADRMAVADVVMNRVQPYILSKHNLRSSASRQETCKWTE